MKHKGKVVAWVAGIVCIVVLLGALRPLTARWEAWRAEKRTEEWVRRYFVQEGFMRLFISEGLASTGHKFRHWIKADTVLIDLVE